MVKKVRIPKKNFLPKAGPTGLPRKLGPQIKKFSVNRILRSK